MSKTFQKLFLISSAIVVSCLVLLRSLNQIDAENLGFLVFWGVFVALILSLAIDLLFIRPIDKIKTAAFKISGSSFQSKDSLSSLEGLNNLASHLDQVSEDLQSKIIESTQDEHELRAILSSMIEGVILINREEKILLLSSPVSQMLDLRSRDAVGKPYWEIIRNKEINEVLSKAFSQRKALRKEVTILFPAEAFFSIQVSPVIDESHPKNFFGVVAVFHDITEIKKLERIRSEFVANASHELKTPLTSIKGFVETLKSGALDDPKMARRFLDIIQTHTERLENLVTDLLRLSSLESKEEVLNIEGISLRQFMDAVVTMYKPQMDKKQQTIEVHVSDQLPVLFADRTKIEQAVSNLLDNAIKFAPEGGRVSISVDEDNGLVRIDVTDSGVGIPQEHLPRIFERFYRVDKSRSRELGGTGLGLAIVKHIAQTHNGRVAVESELNKGSTFSIFLPKNQA